jgi:glycosyltransferase involved in cell wall biosynthesis
VVDSLATKEDLTAFYGVRPERMTVVYPGRDESLHPIRDEGTLASVRARYGLGERYILFMGTLQPRKNLVRLVEAFSELGDPGMQLVLAGKRGWLAEPIFQRVEELGVARAVCFPGYVEDGDLPALLSGAACFAFPSLYEGFGFPVLEAQACGTPVVASSASSVPEVAGEAALYVDPLDSGALARALARILQDGPLRTALIEKGFANVQRFSWRRCAEQVLAVLERVGGNG